MKCSFNDDLGMRISDPMDKCLYFQAVNNTAPLSGSFSYVYNQPFGFCAYITFKDPVRTAQ
jgi:hypothetical protein